MNSSAGSPQPNGSAERVIVVRAGALGDFLLGVPALRALRHRYAGAAIHLVGPMPQAQLAYDLDLVRFVTSIDDPAVLRLFVEHVDLSPVPDAFRDAGVAVAWLRDSNAMAENLTRLGAGAVVCAPPFPDLASRVHVADWLLQTLQAIDVPALADWDTRPWLHASAEAQASAADWIATHAGDGNLMVLHPGSGSARKNWPPAAWAETVIRLRTQYQVALAVTSGPADEAAVSALEAALASAGAAPPEGVLRGLRLTQLVGLLEQARVYLGNDSGVSHLAAGLGTRTVAVFGPTDPALWRPRGPRVRVVGGAAASNGREAIAGARATWPAPEDVFRAAEDLLSRL